MKNISASICFPISRSISKWAIFAALRKVYTRIFYSLMIISLTFAGMPTRQAQAYSEDNFSPDPVNRLETRSYPQPSVSPGHQSMDNRFQKSTNLIKNSNIETSLLPSPENYQKTDIENRNRASTLQTTENPDGIVYLAAYETLSRSRNFYDDNPHWEDIHGALPIPVKNEQDGNISEFTLDPFNPINRAWVSIGYVSDPSSSDGSVWRTDDLNNPSPTWMEVLSEAQINSALQTNEAYVLRIKASTLQQGLIFIVVGADDKLVVGRSVNSGQDWSWSNDLGIANYAMGFELSSHNINRLWVGINQTYGGSQLLPCFCANTGGFYSITQTEGISTRY